MVIKASHGTEQRVCFDPFVWMTLKQISRKTVVDKNEVCRRMLGDVKGLGLNPRLIHKGEAKAKAQPSPIIGPAVSLLFSKF